MFKDLAADRRRCPTLAAVAGSLEPALWAEDPTRALLVVMRRAVARLPEKAAWKCVEGCTWQHVAQVLYFGSEIDSSLSEYEQYLARLKADSGHPWSDRDFGRLARLTRERLAEMLLTMQQEAIEQAQPAFIQGATASASPPNPLYISRPELQERFASAVASGAKLVVIHGLPGMGKSSLAKALADGAPILYVANGVIDNSCLPDALVSIGGAVSPSGAGTSRLLTALLCSDQAPPYVVIDGLDSLDEIDSLLPRSIRSVVIATCRNTGTRFRDNATFVKVSKMEQNEAAAMVQQYLPSTSPAEAEQLAEALDRYPLAIPYACKLIDRHQFEVSQFCDDITSDVVETARRMPTGDNVPFFNVIAKTLAEIRAADLLAAKLISLIACCGLFSSVSRYSMWRWAKTKIQVHDRGKLRPTRFVQAMDVLERYAVVDSVGKDPKRAFDSGWVRMHALTAQLIREQFVQDDVNEIATYLAMITYDLPGEDGFNDRLRRVIHQREDKLGVNDSLEGVLAMMFVDEAHPAAPINTDGDMSDFGREFLRYTWMLGNALWICGKLVIDNGFNGAASRLHRRARARIELFLIDRRSFLRHNDDRPFASRFPEHWYTWASQRWSAQNSNAAELQS